MTKSVFQDRRVSKSIRIRADFAQAADHVWWQGLEDDPEDITAWKHTPYQVADARHDPIEALRRVRGWLEAHGGCS